MSDLLDKCTKLSLEFKIKATEPDFEYLEQVHNHFDVAIALDIPYPLLRVWHGAIKESKAASMRLDYVQLLNSKIEGGWLKIDPAAGERISGRLEREAGKVANLNDYLNACNLLVLALYEFFPPYWNLIFYTTEHAQCVKNCTAVQFERGSKMSGNSGYDYANGS